MPLLPPPVVAIIAIDMAAYNPRQPHKSVARTNSAKVLNFVRKRKAADLIRYLAYTNTVGRMLAELYIAIFVNEMWRQIDGRNQTYVDILITQFDATELEQNLRWTDSVWSPLRQSAVKLYVSKLIVSRKNTNLTRQFARSNFRSNLLPNLLPYCGQFAYWVTITTIIIIIIVIVSTYTLPTRCYTNNTANNYH